MIAHAGLAIASVPSRAPFDQPPNSTGPIAQAPRPGARYHERRCGCSCCSGEGITLVRLLRGRDADSRGFKSASSLGMRWAMVMIVSSNPG